MNNFSFRGLEGQKQGRYRLMLALTKFSGKALFFAQSRSSYILTAKGRWIYEARVGVGVARKAKFESHRWHAARVSSRYGQT